VDYGLETLLLDHLALEWCMTMLVNLAGIPERSVELPQEIEQFANPEVACEVSLVDYKCKEKIVLDFSHLQDKHPHRSWLHLSRAGSWRSWMIGSLLWWLKNLGGLAKFLFSRAVNKVSCM